RHTIFSRDWSSDVCSSDLDELAEELRERRAEPAVLLRNPDPPEPGRAQPLDLLERQTALRLTLQRARRDALVDGTEPRVQGLVGGHAAASRGRAVRSRWV